VATCSASSVAAGRVREYLDETTAATVTVSGAPLIFARERTDLAVNARDYLSLFAVEINRAGRRTHHWFGYVWSTIDKRRDDAAGSADHFVLMADGRALELRPEATSPREVGIATAPSDPPSRKAVAAIFAADPEVFDYVARASELRLQAIRNDQNEEYSPWRDGRAALAEFVQFIRAGGTGP
jgi:hypothetical protein